MAGCLTCPLKLSRAALVGSRSASYDPVSVKARAPVANVTFIRAIGDTVQRRESVRFHLRFPVIFRWKDDQGGKEQNGGFTRDICKEGLFVYSRIPPPRGVTLELEVMLPPLQEGGHGVRLQSEGRVLRIERKGEHTGFAATGDFDLHSAQGSE